jgi:acetylornithine/succinyldiaminopimelate/putrescine aminotransferase
MSEGSTSAPRIVGACEAWVVDSEGRRFIDLCMGYGSVWLGHNNPSVNASLTRQLETYAAPGFLATDAMSTLESALAPLLPATHFLAGVYSTGMEAMESALRAAWAQTGRMDVVGFEGSTHGRSFLTSAIGGNSLHGGPAFVHCLPDFSAQNARRLEQDFKQLLTKVHPAAIVVEPIQMTGGGDEIPHEFAQALLARADADSIPVLFDETLTGLYRCGPRFYFERFERVPDILVIGKGMANGFPCAAVVLRRGFAWDRARVKPGSTFWNHPLACAAAAATLDELGRLNAVSKVETIESVILETLNGLALSGRGALWCLGVPDRARLGNFIARLFEQGVVVSYFDRYIRLLPPIGIEQATLKQACIKIRQSYADTFG